jgi:hypothetical protein
MTEGDLAIPFQDITEDIGLTPQQKDMLRSNMVFKRMSSRTGPKFVEYAKRQIDRYEPDIIIADPLLSYIGANVNAQVDMSNFLRNQLQPVLDETGVIWTFIHHTGKPPREDGGKNKSRGGRAIYDGLGSVELINWARETITFKLIDWKSRTFELEFGKRAGQANLADESGRRLQSLFLKHRPLSENKVVWELADESEAISGASVSKGEDYERKQKKVREFIIENSPVTQAELRVFAEQNNIAVNSAISMANAFATNEGANPRIYKHGRSTYSTDMPVAESPTPAAKTESKKAKRMRLVRQHIIHSEFISLPDLKAWASVTEGAPGVNDVKPVAEAITKDGSEPKIYTYRTRLGGNDAKTQVFSTTPEAK